MIQDKIAVRGDVVPYRCWVLGIGYIFKSSAGGKISTVILLQGKWRLITQKMRCFFLFSLEILNIQSLEKKTDIPGNFPPPEKHGKRIF